MTLPVSRFLLSVLLLWALAPAQAVAATVPPAAPAGAASAAPAPAPALTPIQRALASPVPVWRRNGILVEQGGRALYTFKSDATGQSRCDSRCIALWPPLYAAPDAKPSGPFTLARSSDGRTMWAWRGRPLYRWVSDRRRGAAGGDGVADLWFLVRVPAALEAQVIPYFPMPMPRPGEIRPTPVAAPGAPPVITVIDHTTATPAPAATPTPSPRPETDR